MFASCNSAHAVDHENNKRKQNVTQFNGKKNVATIPNFCRLFSKKKKRKTFVAWK
jgi:hypothetical protein